MVSKYNIFLLKVKQGLSVQNIPPSSSVYTIHGLQPLLTHGLHVIFLNQHLTEKSFIIVYTGLDTSLELPTHLETTLDYTIQVYATSDKCSKHDGKLVLKTESIQELLFCACEYQNCWESIWVILNQ